MKTSSEIFDLIKSLTKSEKRFFKLSSDLQSGTKNYVRLFDFIHDQKQYNEDEIKEYFKNDNFIKHLPSEKNHLFKQVLKSLRAFYATDTTNSIIEVQLKNTEILYRKAMYKECFKCLRYAKRLAVSHEKFYYWFEIISWEKILLKDAPHVMPKNISIETIVEEESQVIHKLRNLAEYQMLYSQINSIFRYGGFSRNKTEREKVNEISNYHLIKGKNTALSISATTICYYIKGLCSATNRDFEDAYLNFSKVLTLFEKHPEIANELQKRHLYTLWHLFNCHIETREFQKAELIIDKIKLLDNNLESNNFKFLTDAIIYIGILQVNALKGAFIENKNLLDEVSDFILKVENKLDQEKIILLYYFLSYSYFGIEDYKNALLYSNKIINEKDKHLRQDVLAFTRIFNLMIHYEMNNQDFLSYAVKSTKRYVSKVDKDYQIEYVMIDYIKKLSNSVKSEISPVLHKMNEEVISLLDNPKERVFLNFINIKSWIQSKINSEPLSETIQKSLPKSLELKS